MMFDFEADFARNGTARDAQVGTAEFEGLKRVTVVTGQRENARQMSFRVDDAPLDPGIGDETLCRIAIAQALASATSLYSANELDQPEAQLNFQFSPWDGPLHLVE
jgi:hypothetical protein